MILDISDLRMAVTSMNATAKRLESDPSGESAHVARYYRQSAQRMARAIEQYRAAAPHSQFFDMLPTDQKAEV